jgi:hypothetical protein
MSACVLGPRDLDGDGDPDPACSSLGHDCDDHDARRRANLDETCDGVDNDCNGSIDDGVIGMPGVRSMPLVSAVVPDDPRGAYAPSADAAGQTLVLVAANQGGLVRLGEASAALEPITNASPDPTFHTLTEDACPVGTDASFVAAACDEADVAIDVRADGSFVAASISQATCGAGILRIARGMPGSHVLRHQGPSTIESVFPSLDTPSTCAAMGTGASRPAIALGDDTHALAVWLRAPVSTAPSCIDGFDVEIAAAGLVLGDALLPTPPAATVPVVSAGPVTSLDRAGTFASPAITRLPSGAGWVVAFGRTDGDLGVALVRAPTAGGPLDVVTLPPVPSMDGSVGALALAVGATEGPTRFELGIAYVAAHDASGACVSSGAAALQTVVLADTHLALLGPPLPLGDASAIALVHLEGGLTAGGAGDPTGGFVVVTVHDPDAFAFRVADQTRALVDPMPIPLGHATRLPHAWSLGTQAGFALVDHASVVVGTLGCVAP